MSIEELNWLYQKAQKMDSIVEIGSWMGRSTHALLSGCRGTVIAIDHFEGSPSERDGAHSAAKTQDIFELFWKNVGHFKNLVAIRMEGIKAARYFKDGEIDMVFIDADHEYPAVKNIMEAWLPKCRKLFCGHDAHQAGTPKAFEELGLKPERPINTIWSVQLC